MELDELKNIWQEENKSLARKIKLNENFLLKLNLNNATGEFNQVLNQATLGRNLALVYCFISVGMAILLIEEISYSLPALVGALAMLWSFLFHLAIEKPDYTGSLVQLQKAICKFRIHMAVHAKYDMAIVALWLITVVPLFLKYFNNIALYNDPKALSIFSLISLVIITLIIVLSRKAYRNYDQKLIKSEGYLAELIALEKN